MDTPRSALRLVALFCLLSGFSTLALLEGLGLGLYLAAGCSHLPATVALHRVRAGNALVLDVALTPTCAQ